MCRHAICSLRKDSSINDHIEQMRLSATKSLIERRDVVIVATVSCIYGIGDRDEYHNMILTMRVGDQAGSAGGHQASDGHAIRAQRPRFPSWHFPRTW